jgi:NAD-dependent deacetylase
MKRVGQADGIALLGGMIAEASRMTVFTGAGVSTESGIPDFRSPGGLWTKMKPIPFQEFVASREVRRGYWRRRLESGNMLTAAEPNAGHRAIARLVGTGLAGAIITQNIDGLHQRAGVPEDKVIELHGTFAYCTCLTCGTRYENPWVHARVAETDDAPDCTLCGGIIKAATISFGQAMPEGPMQRAQDETLTCDLFLAAGSSLQVWPAAGFPVLAKRNGARLVILNREETELDREADLVINAEIGPTLAAILKSN